jgi:uncharacterized protein YkuJ
MNLLDRLKPEYLEKLEIVKKQFPTSAEKIEMSLSENQSVFALTISEASSICMFFDIEMTLSNILNMIEENE